MSAETKEEKQIEQVRIEHEIREIEGWTVHVDVSLLRGDLFHQHRPSYDLISKIWGVELPLPTEKRPEEPSILDLRILARLKAQRGDFDGALELVSQAEARSDDSEGRLADLREHIEEEQNKADK